jgi:hypothetical protein
VSEVLHHVTATPMAGVENVTSVFGNQVVVDVVMVCENNYCVGRGNLVNTERASDELRLGAAGERLEVGNMAVHIVHTRSEPHQTLGD